ncbi:MAG: site-2 protease family protein [Rhodospirillales bacterium 20-64-7]|nr:MAG: site-2 protease family protein [Rhodospirillales bacterium 20-64-7]
MLQTNTLQIVVALVIAVVLHELAHGAVARLFGDQTAERAGRLTLNPLRHIDQIGSIAVPLVLAAGQLASIGRIEFLYGWAKPVPVDPLALRLHGARHPRQLMAVVAAAGPLTNFLLALLAGFALHLGYAQTFLAYFILINLTLGIFNLLPIPPLDGGRILVGILPMRLAVFVARGEKLGIVAVLLILFVLPVTLAQFGIQFSPFNDVMSVLLPWALHKVMLITGHGF